MSAARRAERTDAPADLVVGVTKLAWMYGRSRDWAERLLADWEEEQEMKGGPRRVFRMGKRGSRFTTLPVIHQCMPPGRDLALYRRVEALEEGLEETTRRLDREIVERRRDAQELSSRVGRLECSGTRLRGKAT